MTIPDGTSVYALEANDDFIYYLGNASVTMYRYSIVNNTWTTLTPAASRGAAPGVGLSAHFVDFVPNVDWTNESAILNGKYIFSFRGNATPHLDRYDIALNSWTVQASTVTTSGVVYSPSTETFTTGTKYTYIDDSIYLQKDATGRFFRFNMATQDMDGWCTMLFPQGAAVLGDTMFNVEYKDGATTLQYMYLLNNTSTVMMRQLVI